MTVYVRLWNCGVCGGPVYFDDVKGTIICKCGVIHVNLPMPPENHKNYRPITEADVPDAIKMGEVEDLKADRCFG